MRKSEIWGFVGLLLLCWPSFGWAHDVPDHPPVKGTAPKKPSLPALTVGTKVVRPFAYKDSKGQWTGISVELWRLIAKKIGRDYNWKEAKNTNDLVQRVSKGEFDLGIAAITVKPSRAQIVDFSDTHFKSSLGIATHAGSAGTLALLSQFFTWRFIKPVGLLGLLLTFIGLLIWIMERKKNAEEFPPGLEGLWSGVWWSAVTMTTVGYGDKSPRSFFGRILGLVWMFASIIMISAFTAAIASSLTTRQLASRVRGPQDLPHVRVGAKKGESPVAILKKKYNVTAVPFPTIEAGMKALNNHQIDAFVHDTPVMQAALVDHPELKEKVIVLNKPIREERYGIAIKQPVQKDKRNQLREAINKALIELEIQGKLSEINAKYLGR